jgi:hypothetical protein
MLTGDHCKLLLIWLAANQVVHELIIFHAIIKRNYFIRVLLCLTLAEMHQGWSREFF